MQIKKYLYKDTVQSVQYDIVIIYLRRFPSTLINDASIMIIQLLENSYAKKSFTLLFKSRLFKHIRQHDSSIEVMHDPLFLIVAYNRKYQEKYSI